MEEKKVNIFIRILRFTKFVNHKDELSLTNIAFWVFLYKIAMTDMSSMTANELAAALSVVGLYFGTKVINRNAESNAAMGKVGEVVSKVTEMVGKLKGAGEPETITDEEENADC